MCEVPAVYERIRLHFPTSVLSESKSNLYYLPGQPAHLLIWNKTAASNVLIKEKVLHDAAMPTKVQDLIFSCPSDIDAIQDVRLVYITWQTMHMRLVLRLLHENLLVYRVVTCICVLQVLIYSILDCKPMNKNDISCMEARPSRCC